MPDKIKIAAVSYLNTKPFLFGLEQSPFREEFDVRTFSPATCFEKLKDNSCDIGLIPIATINQINNAEIITDYCIGANGKVSSVLILSQVPIQKIKSVFLDNQSRTSNMLAKVLFKNHWKLQPEFISENDGYESKIINETAGVVIGDRALMMQSQFEYVYDLSEEWFNLTQLPFVFACWVANKKIDDLKVALLNEALRYGVMHIDDLTNDLKLQPNYYPFSETYLKHNISFNFDEFKKQGLSKFFGLMKSL